MDEQKKRMAKMAKKHPECLTDRNRLKALMADYFPNDKLSANLILYVFDEEIVGKLTASDQDVSLHALRVKKTLEKDYGVAEELAAWAVSTWCVMLGKSELADLITITPPKNSETEAAAPKPAGAPVTFSVSKEYIIGEGVHRAGIDFPAGDVSIQVREETNSSITFGISSDPGKLNNDDYEEMSFDNKTYVRIKPGDYLLLVTWDNDKKHTFSVRATGIEEQIRYNLIDQK